VGGDAAKKERLSLVYQGKKVPNHLFLYTSRKANKGKGSPSSLTCLAALELGIKLFQPQNHVPY
jgi:hypothetical protein